MCANPALPGGGEAANFQEATRATARTRVRASACTGKGKPHYPKPAPPHLTSQVSRSSTQSRVPTALAAASNEAAQRRSCPGVPGDMSGPVNDALTGTTPNAQEEKKVVPRGGEQECLG
jgi:hypothetical protein